MDVKVLDVQNGTAQIELIIDGDIKRGLVPEEVLQDNNTLDDALVSLVVPYGLDWEYILEDAIGHITPQRLAAELRRVGLWTIQDLRANPQAAFGALQAVYGLDFSALLRSAEDYANLEVTNGR